MDKMRKNVLWTGGLAICVLAVAMAVRAGDAIRPHPVQGLADSGKLVLLDDINPARFEPMAESYTVRTRYPDGDPRNNNVLARGFLPACGGESKIVYSSKLGQVLFRPGVGNRVADDIITELVRPCSLCSFSMRVTGGVEDGHGEFLAEVSLYDGCPDVSAGGRLIPGTLTLFSGLEDSSDIFHDLTLDYGDRGVCRDGTACVVSQQDCGDGTECFENPLEIPTEIWARIRFNTSTAAIVVGSPPVRGFSADGYDDVFGDCRSYFGGFPTFAHATFFAQVFAPPECETHFLAYLAGNPTAPAFLATSLPGGTPTTRLADDIKLMVPNCVLSAYEVGVKGLSGNFTLETDMRWPNINNIVVETEGAFFGRGESGSLEVAHTTIDEKVNLAINENDQPLWLTWRSNRPNTGVPDVGGTQVGFSLPLFAAYDVDPQNPGQWTLFGDYPEPWPPGNRGVFYAAVFCRGEAPKGACCPDQPAIPGADIECIDDVPVTFCLGSRWLPNTTCAENLFDPPCGTHACCPPDDVSQNLFFDECVEQCELDDRPITCFPVCDGGENDGLECNAGGDGADCPNGFCNPDALCPGGRTCGLTGCVLNGEFTGRPCDPNGADAGASDCMTCSGTGEYCRPRCVGGTRNGRACDPTDPDTCPGDANAVPPVPAGVCDADIDCPGAETCEVHGQTCVTDLDQCSLRCARWEPGEFVGESGFDCPNFACFDAIGDCFEPEPFEILCEDRCDGDPTRPCRFDFECAPDHCLHSDIDCPPGRTCILPYGVCTGRAGCDNFACCEEVCRRRPVCCESGLGYTWDDRCASDAASYCVFPPGNDECWSDAPSEGASEFQLLDDQSGQPCNPSSTMCSAAKLALNTYATANFPDDPEVCCHADGVNLHILGTIWYKFQAVHTSARIHTCGTPSNPVSVDSVIQVFKANNVTPNGDDFDECNSLEVIGCNDDSGCGVTGEHADVCVTGLTPGQWYFVMMGSKRAENLGQYSIEIETPCPSNTLPGPGAECDTAIGIGPGETPFDLAGASIDCPPEVSLPGMTNDMWFSLFANFCDGPSVLTVQTCGYDLDPAEPNPDTTLAVYSGSECPPTELVGANDDAMGDCAPASFVQVPTFPNQFFFIRVGGEFGSEPSGVLRISCERDDCNQNGLPDLLDISNGIETDCNLNGEPDSCDLTSGASNDCDCNSVPDECEIDVQAVVDCAVVTGPCDDGPFFCVNAFLCDPDINANGIPDCCDAGVPPATCADCCVVADDLVDVYFADNDSSDDGDPPTNCAIDAREPHDINNAAVGHGWDRMVMSFSCDPNDIGLDPGDFTVQVVPADAAPQVSSVVLDSVANTVTVILDDKIAPGRWTCIGHADSGNQWCMGYLPADANQDGMSSIGDINALIDSLNRIPGAERPSHATDINRSGITNAQDLLRLIDLLNGAGEFSQWLARELPPCPSAGHGR